MTCIVTFGEVMARLAPAGHLLLRQALPGSLEVTFAGAEANVAASLATLGGEARFVTALPHSPIADACVGTLRGMGIDCSHIVRSEQGRLGLYFVEHGANQRPSRVIYDRDHSTISLTPGDAYDWPAALAGAGWLHVSGITPAISQVAAEATRQAVQAAKDSGATVSCDLNFRGKLWRWDASAAPRDLAGRVMREILPQVDVLVANEEDCKDVLGISLGATDLAAGALDVERYPDVAREVVRQFPQLRFVATTLRESLSASHNNWGDAVRRRRGRGPLRAAAQRGVPAVRDPPHRRPHRRRRRLRRRPDLCDARRRLSRTPRCAGLRGGGLVPVPLDPG
jgi:2-dehydro-3-deoxygluconokinase